jgi:hypothetical protein
MVDFLSCGKTTLAVSYTIAPTLSFWEVFYATLVTVIILEISTAATVHLDYLPGIIDPSACGMRKHGRRW